MRKESLMLLNKVFEPFLKEKPICVMARAVLQRILDPQPIDQLFARTAQRQYTHELLFSTLVDLMSRVVLGQEPSVHAAYRTSRTNSRLVTNPFTTNSNTLNLGFRRLLPTSRHGASAPSLAPSGLRCRPCCPVTGSSSSTAIISRLPNTAWRSCG